MDEDERGCLERRFNLAFYVPAKHGWKSKRGRSHWLDSDVLRDDLAGPTYSIVTTGSCSYLYGLEDSHFCGVDSPGALRTRLQQWHTELVESVNNFAPRSPVESADLASMREFASSIWTAVEAACDIERRRWEAAAV